VVIALRGCRLSVVGCRGNSIRNHNTFGAVLSYGKLKYNTKGVIL